MKISPETLNQFARQVGHDPFTLEKVVLLLDLLKQIFEHHFLQDKLVLKGGTALNLFYFDLPRLSVDIDLNYIGNVDREIMLKEREKIEYALTAIVERDNYTIRRMPTEHAGGKFSLGYNSAMGRRGNLSIDLNFMFRVPLWPICKKNSFHLNPFGVENIPLLDFHELAAGKLAALLSRCASRDLFDAYHLFKTQSIDWEKLRLAFVVYGAIDRKDWRTISKHDVQFDVKDLKSKLLPMLQQSALKEIKSHADWAKDMIDTCQASLSQLLPLTQNEHTFLNELLDQGEINSALLTQDKNLQEKISIHPGLTWKALNVRQWLKKSEA